MSNGDEAAMKPSSKEQVELAARLRNWRDNNIRNFGDHASPINAIMYDSSYGDTSQEELDLIITALESQAAWRKDAMEKVEAWFDERIASSDIYYMPAAKVEVLAILTSTPTAESKASEK